MEQVSFVPVVMSASAGMGKAASPLYARVAALLATKKSEVVSAGQVLVHFLTFDLWAK